MRTKRRCTDGLNIRVRLAAAGGTSFAARAARLQHAVASLGRDVAQVHALR